MIGSAVEVSGGGPSSTCVASAGRGRLSSCGRSGARRNERRVARTGASEGVGVRRGAEHVLRREKQEAVK